MKPLVVVDADVLGRRRTGDETYVLNLLRALPAAAPDLRLAAVTRRPDLVPAGVEPLELPARAQEWRMAWSLPRLLRRVGPALAHFQHALPLACPCPAVVTVHDLSFERDAAAMGWRDRLVFRVAVPRAARRAARVLTVSERTRRDLVELYGIPGARIVVTPNGVDPAFAPGGEPDGFVLFVGAVQARKDPLAAAEAAAEVGLPLVVVGPEKDAVLARRLREGGADVRGYVPTEALARLYREAACVVLPSRYEGFGLPLVEAMASGTPVVAAPDPALREVAGEAAVFAERDGLADGIRRALADRDRLAAAGLARAQRFSWEETARRTGEVYREVLAR
ncbi:MAG: glycosyltransferase family 4 protein [Thermoleophilia bacterium]|nr:glycosyltransferase family 4 protein [Thermoleophilia bacterium]